MHDAMSGKTTQGATLEGGQSSHHDTPLLPPIS